MSGPDGDNIWAWSEDGYVLEMWDTHTVDSMGKSRLGYRLFDTVFDAGTEPIFEGEDFCCSPLHAIDSLESIAGVLGFLSLRPGDTDEEYFADYTPRQTEWMWSRAEYLQLLVYDIENPEP